MTNAEQENAALRAQMIALRETLENERMKVAGCSTAAVGAWKEGELLHPGYECAAIHDVARLYAKYAAQAAELEAANRRIAELEKDVAMWREEARISR